MKTNVCLTNKYFEHILIKIIDNAGNTSASDSQPSESCTSTGENHEGIWDLIPVVWEHKSQMTTWLCATTVTGLYGTRRIKNVCM